MDKFHLVTIFQNRRIIPRSRDDFTISFDSDAAGVISGLFQIIGQRLASRFNLFSINR